MKITLRGKAYVAEHLTDLNYLAIGKLFVEDNGTFALEDVDDYESLSKQQQFKLTQPLMQRLTDPDVKASVAESLNSIFPTVPPDLVKYAGKGNFNLNLTLTELLEVAIAVANALSPTAKKVVRDEEDNEVALLQEQLDRLKAKRSKGFAKN